MYGRGPMPGAMRLVILFFFSGVGFMMLAPMCVAPIMMGNTAAVMAEHAPTEADRQKAAELQAYADEAGVETRITPQQIADAMRDDTVLVSIMVANNEIVLSSTASA